MDLSQYTIAEFALKNFHRPKTGSEALFTFRKKEKEWTWKDVSDLIKFSSKPIGHMLLKDQDNVMNKGAIDSFVCIMKYMGDESLKRNQTVTDCVYELLTLCLQQPQIHDEIYCQIIKQTTNNRSKSDTGLTKGWRLFSILTSYFACSDAFKPYLINYLQSASFDEHRSCYQTARTCLNNLKQTFKYGGRKMLLAGSEVEAITNGKSVKRQVYLLPGGQKKFINTTSVTVAEEVIEQLCKEMNVVSIAEQQEFSLSYIIEHDNEMHIIANDAYILDETTKLTLENKKVMLVLKRNVWIQPLRFDNPLLIDALFSQIIPDYISGLFILNESLKMISAHQIDNITQMAAFIHYSDTLGHATKVTSEYISCLVPNLILTHYPAITKAHWTKRIEAKIKEWEEKPNTQQAKCLFLVILQKWPLFAATFYHIEMVTRNGKNIDTLQKSILSVNHHGIKFLTEKDRNIIIDIPLKDLYASVLTPSPSTLQIEIKNESICAKTPISEDILQLIHHNIFVSLSKSNAN
uniref:Unconventional myosin-XV n=1 Tax=Rhabditophanes sp. KR3021 TaxID=114890 RepID=A0AC35U717_9BILA